MNKTTNSINGVRKPFPQSTHFANYLLLQQITIPRQIILWNSLFTKQENNNKKTKTEITCIGLGRPKRNTAILFQFFFFMLNIQTNVANLNQPQTKLRMRIVCKTFKCHLNCGVIICTHMTMKKKRNKKKILVWVHTTYEWATIKATYYAGRYSYYVYHVIHS